MRLTLAFVWDFGSDLFSCVKTLVSSSLPQRFCVKWVRLGDLWNSLQTFQAHNGPKVGQTSFLRLPCRGFWHKAKYVILLTGWTTKFKHYFSSFILGTISTLITGTKGWTLASVSITNLFIGRRMKARRLICAIYRTCSFCIDEVSESSMGWIVFWIVPDCASDFFNG